MQRLGDKELNYIPEQPFFVSAFGGEVASMDGELTNYDADLLTMGSSIASEPDDGSAFDGFLGLMAFNPGDFQSTTYDPINLDHSAFTAAYEQQLVDNESGLQSDPTPGSGSQQPSPGPQPPTNPAPPAGGGSAGLPPGPYAGNIDFGSLKLNSAPVSYKLTLSSWYSSGGFVGIGAPEFSVTVAQVGPTTANPTYEYTITFTPAAVGTYSGVFQVIPQVTGIRPGTPVPPTLNFLIKGVVS